jgi:hypothetical protein
MILFLSTSGPEAIKAKISSKNYLGFTIFCWSFLIAFVIYQDDS